MKITAKRIGTLVLTLVLTVSVGGILLKQVQYRQSEQSRREAESLVQLSLPAAETDPAPVTEPETEAETEAESEGRAAPESEGTAETSPEPEPRPETEEEPEIPVTDDYADALLPLDLEALRKVNGDVIGWILIPGTTISYPILQGDDNRHYLTHTWDGWWNFSGSIFMDYRSDPLMGDFHTILYGHRMYDNSMFHALGDYRDGDFAAQHPSVYVVTRDGVRRYDVFASYEADVNGDSYRLGLTEEKGQQAFIQYCRKHSVLETGIIPDAADGDRILTLSTCTDTGGEKTRWVVHAVLAYEKADPGRIPGENPPQSPEKTTKNSPKES